MPLSKKRNRDRMRETRLHALLCAPQRVKPVQPKPVFVTNFRIPELDVDGEIIPEEE